MCYTTFSRKVVNMYTTYEDEKKEIESMLQYLQKLNNKELNELVKKLEVLLAGDTHIEKNIHRLAGEILLDIADKENIYIKQDALNNILRSGVLDDNIEDNFKLIFESEGKDTVGNFSTVVFWYANTYFNRSLIKHKKIVPVGRLNITEKDLEAMYHIETLVFSHEIAGKEQTSKNLFEHNPYSFVGARDTATGEIVAFISAYPISDDFCEKILSGQFDDTKIEQADVLQYSENETYKLYVSSLCVHPKYNRTNAFGVVYTAFLDTIEDLAKKGIFISEILADCANRRGEIICKGIGMKKHIKTDHNTVVYRVEITKDPAKLRRIFRKNKNLIDLYCK